VRRPNPNYLHLHEIARHATHSTETLVVAVQVVGNMIIQHDHFVKDRSSAIPKTNVHYKKTRDRLLCHSQMLQSLQHRSEANKERLQNEITLVSQRLTSKKLR